MTDVDHLFRVIENNERMTFQRLIEGEFSFPGAKRFVNAWPFLRHATYTYCHELVCRLDMPIVPFELPSGIVDLRRFGLFGAPIVTVDSRKIRTKLYVDDDITMGDAAQLGHNIACESAAFAEFYSPGVFIPYAPIVPMNFDEGTGRINFGSREAAYRFKPRHFSMRVRR